MQNPDNEETVDFISGQEHTTLCDHFWVPAESDPNSNLVSVTCSSCWAGSSYDPELSILRNGTLTKKGTI